MSELSRPEGLEWELPLDVAAERARLLEKLKRVHSDEAEIARLRSEIAKCAGALPGAHYMDPPDGGDVPVSEQLSRMAKDAARYRFLRRKFAIVGAEFSALNLPRPTYIAPDPATELDAAIDDAVCRMCGHDNDAHDRQYGCAEDGCDCETPNAELTGRAAAGREGPR